MEEELSAALFTQVPEAPGLAETLAQGLSLDGG